MSSNKKEVEMMKLEDFEVYQLSNELCEELWEIVIKWNYFLKDTIGKQLVRAADSVSANLSEGYGRFHFKESLNFAYYSRGSLYETKTWITKAYKRKLINEANYIEFMKKIKNIGVKLNNYITSIKRRQKQYK
ncbi:MAG: four helix bundle protein [Flavobacteriales bacterium]